jgi:hypothetical protein
MDDKQTTEPELTPFERMKELTRRIVHVQKSELPKEGSKRKPPAREKSES